MSLIIADVYRINSPFCVHLRNLRFVSPAWLASMIYPRILPTAFHLEAAIAMQQCVSLSVEATDWGTIVRLYSRLLLNEHVAEFQQWETEF